MKVVINKCYGGFGLSARAIARWAQLKGRPCYFFVTPIENGRFSKRPVPIAVEQADSKETFVFSAYDVPNPDEVLPSQENWHKMTIEERQATNAEHQRHSIYCRDFDRADPELVRVVEELGDAANGKHAKLRVVEIPDGTDYEIDDYDGMESIHERHASWG